MNVQDLQLVRAILPIPDDSENRSIRFCVTLLS